MKGTLGYGADKPSGSVTQPANGIYKWCSPGKVLDQRRCQDWKAVEGCSHKQGNSWCQHVLQGTGLNGCQEAGAGVNDMAFLPSTLSTRGGYAWVSLVGTRLDRYPKARTKFLILPIIIRAMLEVSEPCRMLALTQCQAMLLLGEAGVSLQDVRQSQLVSCNLFLSAVNKEWLHFMGKVHDPEREARALLEPNSDIQPDEGLNTKAGHMSCSSRCGFKWRSHATTICFFKWSADCTALSKRGPHQDTVSTMCGDHCWALLPYMKDNV